MRTESFGPYATLYQGDCREIIPTLPVVDSVVTDPPYGTQDLAGGYGRRQLHNIKDVPGWDHGAGRVIANDRDLSVLQESLPLLTTKCPVGWMFVFYGARKSMELLKLSENLNWFGDVIWDKKAPGLGFHIRYSHESIAVFKQGDPPRPKDALLSIIRAAAPSELHPHEKPIAVMMPIVKWACPENGLVLDPFCGAGATGIAAIKQERRFIGIELEEKYFDISCRRVEDELLARESGGALLEGLGLLA